MAKDPYHYFRIEAQELVEGLGAGLLALDKDGGAEAVRKVLRLAHTLKGAARVVKLPEIGDLAHQVEELLASARDAGNPPRPAIDNSLKCLDGIRRKLAALDAPPQAAPKPDAAPAQEIRTTAADENLQTVRLGISDLDNLIGGIAQSFAAAAELRAGALAAGDTPHEEQRRKNLRALVGKAEHVAQGLAALRASVVEMRLVPAQVLIVELERSVRDAAQSVGKQVNFSASGADTRIDAAVLQALRGALRHIVRNAVAHGVEDERTRVAASKPPAGKVHVAIERRGHRVSVVCRDDGAGFNLESVRRVAIERGLVAASQAARMDSRALVELILHGGVSTARQVSQVSGRGIGLDVARETANALKGELDVRTTAGKGSEVEIIVPISLSSLPALEMEIGGVSAFAPLDSVRQTLRRASAEIARTSEGERVRCGDEFVPYAHLSQVIDHAQGRRGGNQTIVVIESGGRRAAIGVDRLRGVHEIIVRSIPAHARAKAIVAGAAADEQGVPQLVLAPAALVAAVSQPRAMVAEPAPKARPPVLVIDDSLTTRMLEQSILESAGYEVDLAVCAEDGLEMARRRRYGVFIVDVEMPGMNGFEFIAKTRADVELRDVPAILVTSRSDPEDKKRGKDVGARAYVVKSEFDQVEMLKLISRLMG
ncbi:MAG: response regulator [Planctomycetes bacterium]|nr:response regulator [Planctomycetota bacterium]